jgi:hypothetical protein
MMKIFNYYVSYHLSVASFVRIGVPRHTIIINNGSNSTTTAIASDFELESCEERWEMSRIGKTFASDVDYFNYFIFSLF